jgi:hypothetical protein
MQSGEPLPDKMLNAPELFIGLELFLASFMDLDSDRNVGVYERISLMRAKEYGLSHEFDEEQIDSLLYFVPRMDVAYIKFCIQKNKDRQAAENGNTPRPSETVE